MIGQHLPRAQPDQEGTLTKQLPESGKLELNNVGLGQGLLWGQQDKGTFLCKLDGAILLAHFT